MVKHLLLLFISTVSEHNAASVKIHKLHDHITELQLSMAIMLYLVGEEIHKLQDHITSLYKYCTNISIIANFYISWPILCDWIHYLNLFSLIQLQMVLYFVYVFVKCVLQWAMIQSYFNLFWTDRSKYLCIATLSPSYNSQNITWAYQEPHLLV